MLPKWLSFRFASPSGCVFPVLTSCQRYVCICLCFVYCFLTYFYWICIVILLIMNLVLPIFSCSPILTEAVIKSFIILFLGIFKNYCVIRKSELVQKRVGNTYTCVPPVDFFWKRLPELRKKFEWWLFWFELVCYFRQTWSVALLYIRLIIFVNRFESCSRPRSLPISWQVSKSLQ